MEKQAMNAGRGLVIALGIGCLGLLAALAVSASHATRLQSRLDVAALQSASPAPEQAALASRLETLEKLLQEQSAAYTALQNRYAAQTRVADQPPAIAAVPTNIAALAAAPATNAFDRGSGPWLERLRTEDPERYKQIQQAREVRRQQVAEFFDSQLDRLDDRYQAAATQDEADLVAEIADTLGRLDELRQQWQQVRELPEAERRVKAQELGAASHETFQKLVGLRTRDRVLQLNDLARQLGYTDATSTSQFIEKLQRIYDETDTDPSQFMGMRGGFRGGTTAPAPAR